MSHQINQLCEDIKSNITVAGVSVYDLDDIPLSLPKTNCPALMPWPLALLRNWDVEHLAYGTGAGVPKRVTFTLTYRYFGFMVGGTKADFKKLDDAMDKYELIVEAFMNDDDIGQAYDIQPQQSGVFGLVTDPSGEQNFWGTDLLLNCVQER